jgi:membrane protein YdbS with pleckstrin-like domain
MVPDTADASFDWLTLDEGEELVWHGKPHRSSLVPALVVGIPLSVVLVGLFVIASAYITRENTEYVVTTEALYRKSGVLSRNVQRVDFGKVQNTTYSQGFFGKQFGYGNVEISTAGGAGVELSFDSVPNPKAVQERINARVKRDDGEAREGKAAVLDEILAELRAIRVLAHYLTAFLVVFPAGVAIAILVSDPRRRVGKTLSLIVVLAYMPVAVISRYDLAIAPPGQGHTPAIGGRDNLGIPGAGDRQTPTALIRDSLLATVSDIQLVREAEDLAVRIGNTGKLSILVVALAGTVRRLVAPFFTGGAFQARTRISIGLPLSILVPERDNRAIRTVQAHKLRGFRLVSAVQYGNSDTGRYTAPTCTARGDDFTTLGVTVLYGPVISAHAFTDQGRGRAGARLAGLGTRCMPTANGGESAVVGYFPTEIDDLQRATEVGSLVGSG